MEDLDLERSAFTVIERALAWGDVAELRWLFEYYAPIGWLSGCARLAGVSCRDDG